VCIAAKVDDGVQNGAETDVDCGGGVAPACATAKKCKVANDCTSRVCTGNACQAPLPTDGVKNASETDVDCGGGAPAPACGTSKACVIGTRDCTSLVCTGNVCKAATGTDGVKNGDESDKDCGGTTTGAPKCGTGLICNVHADCASDGCDYNKKCAVERSCTAHLGGDTCGAGEIGEAGAVHESCCKTAPIAGFASKLDKYHVTAGRMRAFVERLSGNVRATKGAIPGWQAAWDGLLPSTVAEANTFLGSYWSGAPNDPNGGESKRSCQTTGFGGHTYYVAGAGELGDYAQTDLDPKALNCVGWHLAKAFCTWDHGRLATNAELASAFTNNAANAYPWQFADNTAYSSTSQDPRLVHEYSYGYPGAPRMVSGTVQDITWFIAPPGRRPLGANANGVNDMAGNLLHWVNDAEYDFTWTMSWEEHPKNLTATKWTAATLFPGQPNGYYAIGFRCAHD
jgi:formylglycine-generating enzyme required for sulfatase activity